MTGSTVLARGGAEHKPTRWPMKNPEALSYSSLKSCPAGVLNDPKFHMVLPIAGSPICVGSRLAFIGFSREIQLCQA